MRNTQPTPTAPARGIRTPALALAIALAAVWLLVLAPRALSASPATTGPAVVAPKPPVSATLEQCVSALQQAERSATFSGEMTVLPGTAKMQMRIDVLERLPRELTFHTVLAPGLGVWRTAAPGVKTYKYLKQVTNLAAPAYYRAAVRFRWLNGKGKLIKATELRTARCVQTQQTVEVPPSGGQTPAPIPPPAQ